MPVVPIPCLVDNYAYALFSEGNGQAVVVDPSEAAPVIRCLERLQLRLCGLLLTHHHWDHVGGIAGLRERFGNVPVLAHEQEAAKLRDVTQHLHDGELVTLGDVSLSAMHVPGHTLGALAYRCGNALFTGDTLFAAGCGRLFEGTAEMMFASLSKLAALPPETDIYPGHEYALRNLAFARFIEPGNETVVGRIERISRVIAANTASVPFQMSEELETNPFLRCEIADFRPHPSIDASLRGARLFKQMRLARDGFKS
jgi:hydroxyacylglutathione hydrolase